MKHVFENQSVYDVEIISTTIFDEQFVSNTKNVRGRNLLTNQLQAGQFHFIHDDEDDEYGDEDGEGDDYTDDGYGSTEDEEEALSVMTAIFGESDGGKEDVTDYATDESDWVVDEASCFLTTQIQLRAKMHTHSR